MKLKKLTSIIFLLSFCLSTTSVWGQSTQAKVLFASGYIEFKRATREEWEFVKTGMLLDTADLIRTPPAAILRIEWGEERIKIKGCQEDTVSHLIERFRPTSDKPEPPPLVPGDVNDEALAPREKQMKDSESNSFINKPSAETLNRIATPDAHIREYVASLIREKSFHSDGYPYRNLGIARFLFNKLVEHKINERPPSQEIQEPWTTLRSETGNDMDYAVLYCAWLRAAGVNASFQEKEEKQFITFDANITKPAKLTANHHLYRKKENTIWLPLQITLSETSFVRSWYHGKDAL